MLPYPHRWWFPQPQNSPISRARMTHSSREHTRRESVVGMDFCLRFLDHNQLYRLTTDNIWRQNSSSWVVFIEGMMSNMKKKWEENKHGLCFHNAVMSGLMPLALIKMVCTKNFTFETSLNERSLPKTLWTLLPSCRITSTGQGAQLIFRLYDYIIMMQQYQQNLKFPGGSPIQVLSRPNAA